MKSYKFRIGDKAKEAIDNIIEMTGGELSPTDVLTRAIQLLDCYAKNIREGCNFYIEDPKTGEKIQITPDATGLTSLLRYR